MQNQTDLQHVVSTSPTDPGTGLFMIPNVQSDEYGAMKVLAVPDLTYGECMKRGVGAVAVKWVPNVIANFTSLTNHFCKGRPCVDRCAEPGCMCNPYTGQCTGAKG